MGGPNSMTHHVRNPRTGKNDYAFTPLSSEDITQRCTQLKLNQKNWAQKTPSARAVVLQQFKQALERHRVSLTEALIADTGRRAISIIEIAGVLGALDRWCKQAPEIITATETEIIQTVHPTITTQTTVSPLGMIAVIAPWNFPLTLSMIDTLPALMAGCAVALKPSEITPRFAEPLRTALSEVPELAQVFEIFDGGGEIGEALINHADAVCFTGSVITGRKVGIQAAQKFIPAFLELGGKDPAIVLKSADLDSTTTALLRGSIVNSGQACQSIERIYVDSLIFDDFNALLVKKAKSITFNADDIAHGHLGPIIFKAQADIIAAQLSDARHKGATILSGGDILSLKGGYYCPPTVLINVTHDMAIIQDETFGPILPVMSFATVADAIKYANDSAYGLSAAVFAATIAEAETVAVQLEAGAISINDAALTSMVWEAEKSSFKLSGLGASRMGASGLMRFLRKRALIRQSGAPAPMDAFAEDRIP
jgi:succinate-semialdehyde dehydrogenase / glutarate-semialdehyde dehydrogenase